MLQAMAPLEQVPGSDKRVKKAFYKLERREPNGEMVTGRYTGISGKPLIQVDGPHSAPTQHIGEYKTAVVCRAGMLPPFF